MAFVQKFEPMVYGSVNKELKWKKAMSPETLKPTMEITYEPG
jgi:hypothetical protein